MYEARIWATLSFISLRTASWALGSFSAWIFGSYLARISASMMSIISFGLSPHLYLPASSPTARLAWSPLTAFSLALAGLAGLAAPQAGVTGAKSEAGDGDKAAAASMAPPSRAAKVRTRMVVSSPMAPK